MRLLPTFVVLVLAEAGLRYYRVPTMADPLVGGSVKLHKKSRDPMVIYELVPGAKTVREGVAIAINSAGFRDDEFPETLPDEVYRIVVLGDSVAWGWGVPMAAAFPQVLESQLHEGRLKPLHLPSSITFRWMDTQQHRRSGCLRRMGWRYSQAWLSSAMF